MGSTVWSPEHSPVIKENRYDGLEENAQPSCVNHCSGGVESTTGSPRRRLPEIEATQPRRPWYRPTLLKTVMVALALLIIVPTRANGQFGIDTAAIMAALQKMQSLMSTYMAAPLKTINQSEQSICEVTNSR